MQQAKETYEGVGGANVEAEAETTVCSVTGICTGAGHSTVFLEGMCVITTSAASAKVTVRIRRESGTGTLVSTVVVTPTKGVETSIPVQCFDVPPGELANGTYVMTVQSSAAEKQKSVGSRLAATC